MLYSNFDHPLHFQACEGSGSPAHSRSGSIRSVTSCDGGPGPRASEGSPSRRALQGGKVTSHSRGHMTQRMELKPCAGSAGSPSGSPSRTRDGLRTAPDSGSVLLVSALLYRLQAGAQQEVEEESFVHCLLDLFKSSID